MAGAKEIRGKIASIKNTQKITKAMEMVAASKMRKAQDACAPPAREAAIGADHDEPTPAPAARGEDVESGPAAMATIRRISLGIAAGGACVPALAHLARRDHLHGLGDLLRVFDARDLAAKFP